MSHGHSGMELIIVFLGSCVYQLLPFSFLLRSCTASTFQTCPNHAAPCSSILGPQITCGFFQQEFNHGFAVVAVLSTLLSPPQDCPRPRSRLIWHLVPYCFLILTSRAGICLVPSIMSESLAFWWAGLSYCILYYSHVTMCLCVCVYHKRQHGHPPAHF